jgi:hypothetical protein
MAFHVGETEAANQQPRRRGRIQDVDWHILEHELCAPKEREVAGIVDGAPVQVDEPPARGPLNIGPTHIRAVDRTVKGPRRRRCVARVQIQKFLSAVLSLHSHVDVAVTGEVAT